MNRKPLIVHIVLLAILLINLIIEHFTNYSLSGNIFFLLKVVFILYSIFLFFYYWKSKIIGLRIYFALYLLPIPLLIVGFLFKSLSMGLMIQTILSPVVPNELYLENNHIALYKVDPSFMTADMSNLYIVKENHSPIFEKQIGMVMIQPNFKDTGVYTANNWQRELTKKENISIDVSNPQVVNIQVPFIFKTDRLDTVIHQFSVFK